MRERWPQTLPADPHSDGERRHGSPLGQAILTALMAAVFYGALLGAAYGIISLVTNQDVITVRDVGPLLGPIMAATACVLVFVSVLLSLRPRGDSPRLPWLRAVMTALIVYLFGPVVGGVIVMFDRGDGFAGLFFFAQSVTGPFIAASALAVIPVVLFAPLLASTTNRPR